MGLGGAGGMITQERRTRLAPTSHEIERLFREVTEAVSELLDWFSDRIC